MGKPTDDQIFKAISQLQVLTHLFIQKRSALAREVGLTEPQWRILEQIAQDDFMPSLFATKRKISKAAVSKILRQLQDNGMVASQQSGKDGRNRMYQLTPRGRSRLDQLSKLRSTAIESIWRPIDSSLLDSVIRFNQQLIRNLENNPGSSPEQTDLPEPDDL